MGSGGLVLRRDASSGEWGRLDVALATGDDRLFTETCARGVLRGRRERHGSRPCRRRRGWSALATAGDASLDALPGLSGVWARGADDVLLVGASGAMFHLGDGGIRRPGRSLTAATLHGCCRL